MRGWTVRDCMELYNVPAWGAGFFSVNAKGHVEVQPHPNGPGIDLLDLVQDLAAARRAHAAADALLRHPRRARAGPVRRLRPRHRASTATRAPTAACTRSRSTSSATSSRRSSSTAPRRASASKPAASPSCSSRWRCSRRPGALIICNGYKDRKYIETALLAQRLGRTPIIVVDRFHEVELIIRTSQELGIRPHIGVRARLSTKGAGKWIESTGDRSKFGLTAVEIVEAVDRLRAEGMLDCLELLHFHIGSQITAIRAHKDALREASRIFVGLHEMGAKPRYIDVGGGLGVDYDGSQTNFHSSMNYSVQEYANDVVASIQEACDSKGIPHPDIVTEAGRAMVAHHSVLIFDVLGVHEMLSGKPPEPVQDGDHKVIKDLAEVWAGDLAEERPGGVPRQPAAQGGSGDAVLARLSRPARPRPRRAPVLGLLREDPAHHPRAALRAGRSRAAREGPRRYLLRQLLRLSVGARPLGGQAALPGHADPPARREADAARRVRRSHLRQRRQDRQVHRSSATSRTCSSCTRGTASRTTSACSWSAPTRRSSATTTTSSATPTPCTSASAPTAATRSSTSSRATR